MPTVLRNILLCLILCSAPVVVGAQQPPNQPQVKVNVLNVCTPSAEEKQEIVTALSKIPKQPLFAPDFEVARGRSSLDQKPDFLQAGTGGQVTTDASAIATWTRIRHEFSVQATFSTIQYSFSVDPKNMVETLVFRVRDPKDLLQVSLEDNSSAVAAPASMLGTPPTASRIQLERFGKSSIVLARCFAADGSPSADQSAYESLFQTASGIIANYRGLLQVKTAVPAELARISATPAVKPAAKKK